MDQHSLTIIMQIALAAGLGLAIGLERERSHKPAGLRTYSLIAMGSALFTAISQEVVGPYIDITRIAGQIVTGIGFLGAGLIFTRGDKIVGLTSAAGIWVTAAIGMSVGFRMYTVAIAATMLVLLIMTALWVLEKRIMKKNEENEQTVQV